MSSRKKPQTILLNAAHLADHLVSRMPSAEFTELDKAFFAHIIGIHAVLSRLRRPGTWMSEREGVLGNQPKDLLWLFGDRRIEDLRHVVNHVCTADNKELWAFIGQVHELYAGGIRFDRPEIIRPLRLKLYSYVLFRIHDKGFQQYSRRLQAIIPEDLNRSIDAFEQALQDAATKDDFLRHIKSLER